VDDRGTSHYHNGKKIQLIQNVNGGTYFGRSRGDSRSIVNVGKRGQFAHGFGTVIATSLISTIISSKEAKDHRCRIAEKVLNHCSRMQWAEQKHNPACGRFGDGFETSENNLKLKRGEIASRKYARQKSCVDFTGRSRLCVCECSGIIECKTIDG
jgi:hypothetical protein